VFQVLKNHFRLACLCLIIMLWLAPGLLMAQGERQWPSFKPTIKRVAVFKNGYVFTYREGVAAPQGDGWVYTTEVPIGVMGTVWGYATTPQARVTQLLATEAIRKDVSRAANLEELLFINEGSRVRVKSQYSEKILEGIYVILSPRRTFTVGTTGVQLREVTGAERIQNGESDIAVTTESGVTVMRTSNIAYLEFLGQPQWDKLTANKEHRLALKTENVTAGQTIGLGVAALERGIRWIPAYRIVPSGEPVTEARLELEAMVINELTDISDAEFYFVVGVPHFLYQEMISPLSLSQTFAGVSSYFSVSQQNQYANSIMTQSRAGELRPSGGGDASTTVPEDESLTAMSADELFLYRSNQIDLKKGERASLRLFSLTVPCREIFTWTIPDGVRSDEYTSRSLTNLTGGFWRSLKLKNQTTMPWTTAPALTLRDWKPLGQDILAFTPVNTETLVRVTPATEVVGTHKMEEKSRVRQVINASQTSAGVEYDLVTVEGTIKLRNVKKQPVDVLITRQVSGDVKEASGGGVISREGAELQSINPRSVVKWEFSLPPGEMQLRYVYSVYVRR
jgi:hypothetical protein